MNEKFKKYAELLLKGCLNIEAGRPLLILAPIETYPFVRVLVETAYELGIKDIAFDWEDETLKRIQLENLTKEELSTSSFWNKSIFEKYAEKDAAVLTLCTFENEDLSHVEPELLGYTGSLYVTSRPFYKKKQLSYQIPWCFASAATSGWAKKMFPNSTHAMEELWEAIFHCCMIDHENPLQAWEEKKKNNKKYCDWLNRLQLSTLHYENKLGTNFTIRLPEHHFWFGTSKISAYGKEIIVNMPTEEIYTSPDRNTAEGILYSSKPLVYNGSLIEDFYFVFQKGRVVDCGAKRGLEVLKQILQIDPNASKLGEVALVNYDSPISQSGLIFYETLYDENASCHFALGNGFPRCIPTGDRMSKEELLEHGLNQSDTHVDFMVGTEDLTVIGTKKNGEKILVMKNGNIQL